MEGANRDDNQTCAFGEGPDRCMNCDQIREGGASLDVDEKANRFYFRCNPKSAYADIFSYGRKRPWTWSEFQSVRWRNGCNLLCDECIRNLLLQGALHWAGNCYWKPDCPFVCDLCEQAQPDSSKHAWVEGGDTLYCFRGKNAYRFVGKSPPNWFQRHSMICSKCASKALSNSNEFQIYTCDCKSCSMKPRPSFSARNTECIRCHEMYHGDETCGKSCDIQFYQIESGHILLSGGYDSAYDTLTFQMGRNPMTRAEMENAHEWSRGKDGPLCDFCIKDMLRQKELRWIGGCYGGPPPYPVVCDVCDKVQECGRERLTQFGTYSTDEEHEDPFYYVDNDYFRLSSCGGLYLFCAKSENSSYHFGGRSPPAWFRVGGILCGACFRKSAKDWKECRGKSECDRLVFSRFV